MTENVENYPFEEKLFEALKYRARRIGSQVRGSGFREKNER